MPKYLKNESHYSSLQIISNLSLDLVIYQLDLVIYINLNISCFSLRKTQSTFLMQIHNTDLLVSKQIQTFPKQALWFKGPVQEVLNIKSNQIGQAQLMDSCHLIGTQHFTGNYFLQNQSFGSCYIVQLAMKRLKGKGCQHQESQSDILWSVLELNPIVILSPFNLSSLSLSLTVKQPTVLNQIQFQLTVTYLKMKNFAPQYFKGHNPVQNYYSNMPSDSKQNGQIKRVRSSQNILMPTNKQLCYDKKPEKNVAEKQNKQKAIFIQPGKPVNECFEQTLSTTSVTENGVTTYFIAKALKGPMLKYASQQCNKKQAPKKPSRKIPQIPESICGNLEPHIEGYSTITHEGLYRTSNQDKITIYLEQSAKWFSVYDGHGGANCSQFLKDNLHQIFFKMNWKNDVPNALRKSFLMAQEQWRKKGDNSGSCALVAFIYQNICYTANLGDSRAVLASQNCQKFYQITKDHKPSNPDQQKRIISAGGKIYQTTAITETDGKYYDQIVGPLRVFPGRLSTTRTFGDFQAKANSSKVVICEPEITSFEIDDHDFIVIGSDGVWDRIQNKQAVQIMKKTQQSGAHKEQWYKKGSENLILQSMVRGSTDNISVIIVGLNDPETKREPKKGNQHIKIMSNISSTMSKKQSCLNDKQNFPEKIKQIDSRISQINKNAKRILLQSRSS